jgi:hypothetical protein
MIELTTSHTTPTSLAPYFLTLLYFLAPAYDLNLF